VDTKILKNFLWKFIWKIKNGAKILHIKLILNPKSQVTNPFFFSHGISLRLFESLCDVNSNKKKWNEKEEKKAVQNFSPLFLYIFLGYNEQGWIGRREKGKKEK
jgi:hypothetical protein